MPYISSKMLIILVTLFFLNFILIAELHKRFSISTVLNNVYSNYKKNHEISRAKEKQFHEEYGAIENNSFLYKLDRLVFLSNLKNILPEFTGEYLFISMVSCGLAGGIIGTAISGNFYLGIFIGVLGLIAPYMILRFKADRKYDDIENNLSIFISLLCDNAKGSNDIVYIMTNTIPSLKGYLKNVVKRFVMDANKTGSTDIAFDIMKESVENRQLQTIVLNLKNCSHFQANYEEVLFQINTQISNGLTAREERRNILFSSKVTIVIISLAFLITGVIITKSFDINIVKTLLRNFLGQFLLLITALLYLFIVIYLFSTDREK